MYQLTLVLPPMPVRLTGRPIQAVLNGGLPLLLWVPGVIHAMLVVNEHQAERRAARNEGRP